MASMSASTTTTCRLLSLPTELRELILIFALVTPDPLPAYMEHRFVPTSSLPPPTVSRQREFACSDAHHWKDREPKRCTRLRRCQPPTPVLAQTNNQLRDEALAVFYGRNTFIFGETTPGHFDLTPWMHAIPYEWTEHAYAEFTICLEFNMQLPSPEPCASCGRPEALSGAGVGDLTITANRPRTGELSVQLGGALLRGECTCGIVRLVRDVNERPGRHNRTKLRRIVMGFGRDFLPALQTARPASAPPVQSCRVCLKPQLRVPATSGPPTSVPFPLASRATSAEAVEMGPSECRQ